MCAIVFGASGTETPPTGERENQLISHLACLDYGEHLPNLKVTENGLWIVMCLFHLSFMVITHLFHSFVTCLLFLLGRLVTCSLSHFLVILFALLFLHD